MNMPYIKYVFGSQNVFGRLDANTLTPCGNPQGEPNTFYKCTRICCRKEAFIMLTPQQEM